MVNLGIAGMLHDIGKTKLPAALRTCTAISPPTDEADRAAWEAHCHLGYELIKGGLEPSAAATVLHHHQHFDGSGFPALEAPRADETHQAGESIHIFARILRLADLFDHLTVSRSTGRRPNVQILHLLCLRDSHCLDPRCWPNCRPSFRHFPPAPRSASATAGTRWSPAVYGHQAYFPTGSCLAPDRKSIEPQPIRLGLPTGLSIVQVGNLPVAQLLPPMLAA